VSGVTGSPWLRHLSGPDIAGLRHRGPAIPGIAAGRLILREAGQAKAGTLLRGR
jgi:hypothetical protein